MDSPQDPNRPVPAKCRIDSAAEPDRIGVAPARTRPAKEAEKRRPFPRDRIGLVPVSLRPAEVLGERVLPHGLEVHASLELGEERLGEAVARAVGLDEVAPLEISERHLDVLHGGKLPQAVERDRATAYRS
jgi:hypothetical protein